MDFIWTESLTIILSNITTAYHTCHAYIQYILFKPRLMFHHIIEFLKICIAGSPRCTALRQRFQGPDCSGSLELEQSSCQQTED